MLSCLPPPRNLTLVQVTMFLQVFDPEQFGALAQLMAKLYFVTGSF